MKVPSKFYFLTSPGPGGIPPPLDAPRLANPNIAGWRWRQDHSKTQTARGTFNWVEIDNALAACVISGQKFGLSISWGNTVGRWIYDDEGVTEFMFDPINDDGSSMPDIFDPLYLPILLEFYDILGLRYNTHPNVSYVVVSGCMQHFEGYLAKTADEETRLNASAVAAGYADLAEGWLDICQQIMNRMVTAFPDTAVLYTSAKPFPSDGSGSGGVNQNLLRDWISSTNQPHQGWMTAQLHAEQGPWQTPTDKIYPFGFQAIQAGNQLDRMYNVVPDPPPVPPQIMIDFIRNGWQKAAQFLEIYRSDMDLAINQATFAELSPLFHSFTDYVPPGVEPPPDPDPDPPPPIEGTPPPVVIARQPVPRIIECKTGTHARNIILGRKRLGPPVVVPQAPGPVEILNVVTPHEPSSGQATATFLSPVGFDPADLVYITYLTGGSGTITIVSREPA